MPEPRRASTKGSAIGRDGGDRTPRASDPDAFLFAEPYQIGMNYQPGVCNIGPAQQRRRLLLGVGSLVAAVALVGATFALSWPRLVLLASVFPLYGAAIGVIQYRERFCIGFAGIGVFDVGDGTSEVADEAALAADREKAVRLNLKAVAVAVPVALAVYAVAVFVA